MTTTPARDADRRQRWEDAMAGPIANPRLIRSAATEGMHMADLEAAEVRAAALDAAADRLEEDDHLAAAAELREWAATARHHDTKEAA